MLSIIKFELSLLTGDCYKKMYTFSGEKLSLIFILMAVTPINSNLFPFSNYNVNLKVLFFLQVLYTDNKILLIIID